MNVRVRKRMLRKYWERKCVQTRKKRGKKKREEEIKKKDAGHLGGMKSLRIRKQTPFASLLWEKKKEREKCTHLGILEAIFFLVNDLELNA